MFCYSNNGFSMRSVDANYQVQDGEVVFPDYATEEQLQAAFPDREREANAPQIIIPAVDQEKADLWEAILALTEKIETLEGGTT